MQAVILAAGQSSRMQDFLEFRPKSLFKIEGESILEKSINNLGNVGIVDITIVVGHEHVQIENEIHEKFPDLNIIRNNFYESRGSMYSLKLAFENFKANKIVLDGDLVYDKKILEYISGSYLDSVILTPHSNSGDECPPIFQAGKLIDFDKSKSDFPEYIGISFFREDTLEKMCAIDKLNSFKLPYEKAFAQAIFENNLGVNLVYTPGLLWTDFDTPDDANKVQKIANLITK